MLFLKGNTPRFPVKKERCNELEISWITAPLPALFNAFINNLDNRINNLIKFAYEKIGRTASILDGKQNLE